MNLKERIQQLCKEEGVSMNQLENELNFGRGYISKLGSSTPNVTKIKLIADYFNVSLEYLISGDDVQDVSPYSHLDGIYLSYAKEAQENGILPDDIRLALETIKKLRGGA